MTHTYCVKMCVYLSRRCTDIITLAVKKESFSLFGFCSHSSLCEERAGAVLHVGQILGGNTRALCGHRTRSSPFKGDTKWRRKKRFKTMTSTVLIIMMSDLSNNMHIWR